jgi:carbonic anhydrase
MAMTTRVEQASTISKEDVKTKLEESSTAKQQIKNVLEQVNKIEQNTGTEIQEIKVGDLQMSRNAISLKRNYSKRK